MPETRDAIADTPIITLATRAGWKLKQIRERLNLTLRAVEGSCLEIADASTIPSLQFPLPA
ncbi:MAG TPA: hypothetical protein VGV68_07290 [Terriglobia bacterium]|nr:hypothetical protein [Terriglobia bacterium]